MSRDLGKLREQVSEQLRRAELSPVEKWLEDEGKYYERYPNEVIYANTLVKAMKAINETIKDTNAK